VNGLAGDDPEALSDRQVCSSEKAFAAGGAISGNSDLVADFRVACLIEDTKEGHSRLIKMRFDGWYGGRRLRLWLLLACCHSCAHCGALLEEDEPLELMELSTINGDSGFMLSTSFSTGMVAGGGAAAVLFSGVVMGMLELGGRNGSG